jgi:transcriptional regulator with XRE-family HTH domain
MDLSERIRKAIGKRSPDEIADKLKISRSAVYQWLDGTTKNLKNQILFDLAEETGYSAKWIATEEGPEKLPPQTIDIDLSFLSIVITEVERFLTKERRTLESDKKAKLITLLYEIYVGRGNVEQPAIARYLRLVG